MAAKLGNQLFARIREEMSRNIATIKKQFIEWLERPESGDIETLGQQFTEISGGLSLLDQNEAAQLSEAVSKGLKSLSQQIAQDSIALEQFADLGAELAAGLLFLEDYVHRLGYVTEVDAKRLGDVLQSVLAVTDPDKRDVQNSKVRSQISEETYKALSERIGEIIENNRNQIDQQVRNPQKNFNTQKLIEQNLELIQIFALLSLDAPQLLLAKINESIKVNLSEKEWIDIAEAMILVEEALKQAQMAEKKSSTSSQNVAQAIEQQTSHSRALEVHGLIISTSTTAGEFFQALRKDVVHYEKVLTSQPWWEAALRLSRYGAVFELVGFVDFGKALQRLGLAYAELTLQTDTSLANVYPPVVESLAALEFIFNELTENTESAPQGVNFLSSAIQRIQEIIPTSRAAEELYQSLATYIAEEEGDVVEDLSLSLNDLGTLESLDIDDFSALEEQEESAPEDVEVNFGVLGQAMEGAVIAASAPVQAQSIIQMTASSAGGEVSDGVSIASAMGEGAGVEAVDAKAQTGTQAGGMGKSRSSAGATAYFAGKSLDELEALSIPEEKLAFSASHEDAVVDEEIREFFIEEFREIVEQLRGFYPQWRKDPHNERLTNDIRRMFHTLKGSGRTVGYEALGEFAWQHERLLNNVIDKQYQANVLVQDTVSDALDLLNVLEAQELFVEPKGALLRQAIVAEDVRQHLLGENITDEKTLKYLSSRMRLADDGLPAGLDDGESEVVGISHAESAPAQTSATLEEDLADLSLSTLDEPALGDEVLALDAVEAEEETLLDLGGLDTGSVFSAPDHVVDAHESSNELPQFNISAAEQSALAEGTSVSDTMLEDVAEPSFARDLALSLDNDVVAENASAPFSFKPALSNDIAPEIPSKQSALSDGEFDASNLSTSDKVKELMAGVRDSLPEGISQETYEQVLRTLYIGSEIAEDSAAWDTLAAVVSAHWKEKDLLRNDDIRTEVAKQLSRALNDNPDRETLQHILDRAAQQAEQYDYQESMSIADGTQLDLEALSNDEGFQKHLAERIAKTLADQQLMGQALASVAEQQVAQQVQAQVQAQVQEQIQAQAQNTVESLAAKWSLGGGLSQTNTTQSALAETNSAEVQAQIASQVQAQVQEQLQTQVQAQVQAVVEKSLAHQLHDQVLGSLRAGLMAGETDEAGLSALADVVRHRLGGQEALSDAETRAQMVEQLAGSLQSLASNEVIEDIIARAAGVKVAQVVEEATHGALSKDLHDRLLGTLRAGLMAGETDDVGLSALADVVRHRLGENTDLHDDKVRAEVTAQLASSLGQLTDEQMVSEILARAVRQMDEAQALPEGMTETLYHRLVATLERALEGGDIDESMTMALANSLNRQIMPPLSQEGMTQLKQALNMHFAGRGQPDMSATLDDIFGQINQQAKNEERQALDKLFGTVESEEPSSEMAIEQETRASTTAELSVASGDVGGERSWSLGLEREEGSQSALGTESHEGLTAAVTGIQERDELESLLSQAEEHGDESALVVGSTAGLQAEHEVSSLSWASTLGDEASEVEADAVAQSALVAEGQDVLNGFADENVEASEASVGVELTVDAAEQSALADDSAWNLEGLSVDSHNDGEDNAEDANVLTSAEASSSQWAIEQAEDGLSLPEDATVVDVPVTQAGAGFAQSISDVLADKLAESAATLTAEANDVEATHHEPANKESTVRMAEDNATDGLSELGANKALSSASVDTLTPASPANVGHTTAPALGSLGGQTLGTVASQSALSAGAKVSSLTSLGRSLSSLGFNTSASSNSPSANAVQRLSQELSNLSQKAVAQEEEEQAASESSASSRSAVFLRAVDRFENLSQLAEKEQSEELVDELLDSIYDIEDSLTDGAPDWVWQVLDSIEQLLLNYKYTGEFIAPSAAEILRRSAGLIENFKASSEHEVMDTIGDLMGARKQSQNNTATAEAKALSGSEAAFNAEDMFAAPKASTVQLQELSFEAIPDPNAGSSLAEMFLDEAMDLFGRSHAKLEEWDGDREQLGYLDAVRRNMHTLKGSARMAGYMAIGDLTHSVESLIDSIVDGYAEGNSRAAAILMGAMWQGITMLDSIRDGFLPNPDPYILNNIHGYLGQPLPYPEIAAEVEEEKRVAAQQSYKETQAAALREQAKANQLAAEKAQAEAEAARLEEEQRAQEALANSDNERAQAFAENMDPVLVEIFTDEAQELLSNTGNLLQESLKDMEVVHELQRAMHTLKGGARLVGLMSIGDTAHLMESVIERVPDFKADEKVDQAKVLLNHGLDAQYLMLDSVMRFEMPIPETAVNESLRLFAEEGVFTIPEPRMDNASMHSTESSVTEEESPVEVQPATADVEVSSEFEPSVELSSETAIAEVSSEVVAAEIVGAESSTDEATATAFVSYTASGSSSTTEAMHAAESALESDDVVVSYVAAGDTSVAVPAEALAEAHVEVETAYANDKIVAASHQTATNDVEAVAGASMSYVAESSSEVVATEDHAPVVESVQEVGAGKKGKKSRRMERVAEKAAARAKVESESAEEVISESQSALTSTQTSSQVSSGTEAIEEKASDVQSALGGESVAPALADKATQSVEVEKAQAEAERLRLEQEQAEKAKREAEAKAETERLAKEAAEKVKREAEAKAEKERLEREQAEKDKASKALSANNASKDKAKKETSDLSRFVRVDSDLLDEMIAMLGESVIMRSRMENVTADSEFNLNELMRVAARIAEQVRRLDSETEAQMLSRRDRITQDDETFDPLEMDRFSELQQLSRQLSEAIDDLKSIQDTLSQDNTVLRNLTLQQGIVHRNLQDRLLTTQLMRFDVHEPRLRRLIKQTALSVGKEVNFVLEGGEVELERRLLEDMLPSLEHMIRNSIAHGIERPEERRKVGKPEVGTIKVAVSINSLEISVRIIDDGAGIDYDKIRAKAKQKGWLDAERAHDENYLNTLMMRSGFSTADSLSQLSGRGVGMDVVHEMLKQRRGQIHAYSIRGKGTEFEVNMPFSMSIAEVLLVDIGGQVFAAPMNSIMAIVQLGRDDLLRSIGGETIYYPYQGQDYRLYALGSYFKPEQYEFVSEEAHAPALLINSGGETAAFHVDHIINRLEIIVKNVNRQVLNIPGISGATILGDGRVVPVLELSDLARRIDVVNLNQETVEEEIEVVKNILVVDDSVTMRKVSTRLLEKNGYQVATAKDGLDAIDVLATFTPDLIMLDIEMPRMDGFEFASHVRQNSHVPNVPIIMITSRTGDKHRQRADQIGVQGYLGKPYREDVLIDTLHELLNQKGG